MPESRTAHTVEHPFPGMAHAETSPDRMSAIARLRGLETAPPARCRMLELGCGEGVNLLSAALVFPGSRFVGVDSAPLAIARARSFAEELGLRNVEFVQRDFTDLPPDLGEFDFVTALGVYSWIPEPARDLLLAAAARHAARNAVVHVSFNAYPGQYVQTILRSMMLFHVRGIPDEMERARRSQEFARFLAGALQPSNPHASWLAPELRRVLECAPATLAHDELAPINEPVFFRDFCDHARRHGLVFLAEANWATSAEHDLPEPVRESLARIAPDRESREQYLDFIRMRRFHNALLRRSDAAIGEEPDPQVVRGLHVGGAVRFAEGAPNAGATGLAPALPGPEQSEEVRIVAAAMHVLAEIWPHRLPFDELLERARALSGLPAPAAGRGPDVPAEVLAEALFDAFEVGLAGLHVTPSPCARIAGERPVASPLARLLTLERKSVPSLLHENVGLENQAARCVLALLDGTRDRETLLRLLASDTPAVPELGPVDILMDAPVLEQILGSFARVGLLLP